MNAFVALDDAFGHLQLRAVAALRRRAARGGSLRLVAVRGGVVAWLLDVVRRRRSGEPKAWAANEIGPRETDGAGYSASARPAHSQAGQSRTPCPSIAVVPQSGQSAAPGASGHQLERSPRP